MGNFHSVKPAMSGYALSHKKTCLNPPGVQRLLQHTRKTGNRIFASGHVILQSLQQIYCFPHYINPKEIKSEKIPSDIISFSIFHREIKQTAYSASGIVPKKTGTQLHRQTFLRRNYPAQCSRSLDSAQYTATDTLWKIPFRTGWRMPTKVTPEPLREPVMPFKSSIIDIKFPLTAFKENCKGNLRGIPGNRGAWDL